MMSRNVKFIRGFLFLANTLFLLIGIGLIVLGAYAELDDSISTILNKIAHATTFENKSFGYLAFATIGGGVFTIIIASIGLIGAIKSNTCLLKTYTIISLVVILVEFTGFIMAFAYQNQLEQVYRQGLDEALGTTLQKNETDVLDAFHQLEKTVGCCGANGSIDYISHNFSIPDSCTGKEDEGCATAIIDLLKKRLPLVGGLLVVVVALEILALLSSIVMISALKRYDREDTRDTEISVFPPQNLFRRMNYRKVT